MAAATEWVPLREEVAVSTITYGTSDASSQKRAGASGCESAVRIPKARRPLARADPPRARGGAAERPLGARAYLVELAARRRRQRAREPLVDRQRVGGVGAASHCGAAAPSAAPPSHASATNRADRALAAAEEGVRRDRLFARGAAAAGGRLSSSDGPSAFDVQRSWAPFSVSPHAATATLRSASSQPSFGSVTIASDLPRVRVAERERVDVAPPPRARRDDDAAVRIRRAHARDRHVVGGLGGELESNVRLHRPGAGGGLHVAAGIVVVDPAVEEAAGRAAAAARHSTRRRAAGSTDGRIGS